MEVKPQVTRTVAYVIERSYNGKVWRPSVIYSAFGSLTSACLTVARLRAASASLGDANPPQYRVVEVTNLWIMSKREVGIQDVDPSDG